MTEPQAYLVERRHLRGRYGPADFKDERGEWRDVEDWPHVSLYFVCLTTGCPARGTPYEMRTPVNVDGEIRSLCGRCKQPTVAYESV